MMGVWWRVCLSLLQDFLRDGAGSLLAAEEDLAQDRQREGVIVFLGSLAQFLPPGDPKVCVHANR